MRSRTCPKTAIFSRTQVQKEARNSTKRHNLKVYMTTLPKAVLPRYQETASRIRNPSFVLRLTVLIQQCTDLSKPYVGLHPSLRTPHPFTITLHVLQRQLFCGRVPCYPCMYAFFIQSLHDLVRMGIPKFLFFFLISTFLSRKVDSMRSNMVCNGSTQNHAGHSSTLSTSVGIYGALKNPSSTAYPQ